MKGDKFSDKVLAHMATMDILLTPEEKAEIAVYLDLQVARFEGWTEAPAAQDIYVKTPPNLARLKSELCKTFHRRETTAWSDKEKRALCKCLPIMKEDLEAVLEYYGQDRAEIRGSDIRRRTILTLLHNWPGEIDLAREWKATKDRVPVGNDSKGNLVTGRRVF